MFLVDAHCDTLHGMLVKDKSFKENDLQIDLDKLKQSSNEGFLQFFAVFESPSLTIQRQISDVKQMINSFKTIIKEYGINRILSKNDLRTSGLNALLSLEGLYFIDGNTDLLDGLYDDGVRCLSVTWNPDNEFSGGVAGKSNLGLSKKGYKIINKSFEKGILVDVSHITDKGFHDIAEIAEKYGKPFVATHSNVRKICSHKRNLSDQMLKVLAKADGVSGINMYTCFLSDNCQAGIDDVLKHIEYICGLTGPEHVGFGCDFDGIDRDKSALEGPMALQSVLENLLQLNYKEADVKKIASENFIRVLGEVLE